MQCMYRDPMQIFNPILCRNSGRDDGGRAAQSALSYCLNTHTPFSHSFLRKAAKSLLVHHFDLYAKCGQVQYSW